MGAPAPGATCVDTDNGAKDTRGEPCKTYNDWAGTVHDHCHRNYFNSATFNAPQMCCGCGGGKQVNNNQGATCAKGKCCTRMPTKCKNRLSEPGAEPDPTKWFVDIHSRNEATCIRRIAAFNN